MPPIFTSDELAPTTADRPPGPPPPPKLVTSDRRPDPSRWREVIPPSLAAELGDDAGERAAHLEVLERWEQATQRVDDLRQQHTRAEAADAEAEQRFATGKAKKLPEPTAAPIALELTGATRAVELLEGELVASGRRVFASALPHVEAAQAALQARLEADDARVERLIGDALALLDERALVEAEGRWLTSAQWEPTLSPYRPRAAGGNRVASELRELARMLEHERDEARRKRFERAVEIEMGFVAPRVPRPLSARPKKELRDEAIERLQARGEVA